MKITIIRGKIEGFYGSWQSGIATLAVGGVEVFCDNAPTVRALDAAFGKVITSDHQVSQKAIVGKDIVYSMDEMGLMMAAFTPTKQWRDRHGQKKTPKLGETKAIEVE
jgi:hypothetical protein